MDKDTIQEYTLTVFCENKTGLLSRIVSVITRRHYNIESLTGSPSAIEGIFRFTIMVNITHEQVRKLVGQIEKQIDVLKVFYYTNDEIIHQEVALYKIPTEVFYGGNSVEKIIRKHNARVLAIEKEYIVIEKTGHLQDTEDLLDEFKKIGIYEFVRSGRVAIVKPMER
ncbi:MAG TPA: acetolactate synthase small subunit, partial [Saprospiraceae bacterium]|nr:acetolactate synthase small subunit [Saprospiraceae bacterium]